MKTDMCVGIQVGGIEGKNGTFMKGPKKNIIKKRWRVSMNNNCRDIMKNGSNYV